MRMMMTMVVVVMMRAMMMMMMIPPAVVRGVQRPPEQPNTRRDTGSIPLCTGI